MKNRQYDVLILVRNGVNITTLSFESKTTYPNTHKIVKNLEKEGYLSIKKMGRESFISLTKRGLELKKKLLEIDKI